MIRNIENIKRDLEKKKNNDIIWKKSEIQKILETDPDILEVLGKKEKRPYTVNMTEEEKAEVDRYNEAIQHKQIVPWEKLNGIQKEVLNFIMYDVEDYSVSYTNNSIKNQYIIFRILVHEDDMETEYEITRADLLSYLIRDLFCWSNCLGMQLKLIGDKPDILDAKYYCRKLVFSNESVNQVNVGVRNKYDRY